MPKTGWELIGDTGAYLTNNKTGHFHDPILSKHLPSFMVARGIRSVIDIGCGLGLYGNDIRNAQIHYRGFDANPNVSAMSGGRCEYADFSKTNSFGLFDCVLSLEVGEHIPKKYEAVFLDNIASHSNGLIILSWALVGQGGHGHVNCQDNDYIIAQMHKRKCQFNQDMTDILRKHSSLKWLKNTIMVFTK
jgi:hypothetical protein